MGCALSEVLSEGGTGMKGGQGYWASQQVIGRDFSENYPGVVTLALAVGSRVMKKVLKVNTLKLFLQAAETPSIVWL